MTSRLNSFKQLVVTTALILVAAIVFCVVSVVCVGKAYADIMPWTSYTENGSSIEWMIDDDGVFKMKPLSGDRGILKYNTSDTGTNSPPWESQKNSITSVDIEGTIELQGSMSYMFSNCHNLGYCDFSHFDTSHVTSMYYMFYNCTSNDFCPVVGGFNTASVTNMSWAFAYCTGNSFSPEVANWDTSNVTDMSYLFYYCTGTAFTSLDLSKWDVSKATRMDYLCNHCTYLKTFIADNWDITASNHSFFSYSFGNCPYLERVIIRNLTDHATGSLNMTNMGLDTLGYLKYVDFSNWTITCPLELRYDGMFRNCPQLEEIHMPNFYAPQLTSIARFCEGCASLRILDIPNWTVASSSMFMRRSFAECSSLLELRLDGWNHTELAREAYGLVGNNTVMEYADISPIGPATQFDYDTFNNCPNLKRIKVGESGPPTRALFPTPPTNDVYTGKWIREDDDGAVYGAMTPAEIMEQSDPAMAGMWVWEGENDTGVILLEANGGFISGQTYYTLRSSDTLSLPAPSRLGYTFLGWSDGSETLLSAGTSVSPTVGSKKTYTAQWQHDESEYTVTAQYLGKDLVGDGYTVMAEQTFTDVNGTIINAEKSFTGYVPKDTNPSWRITITSDEETVQYYYDRTQYDVIFNRNGADMGIDMNPLHLFGGVGVDLTKNTFSWLGRAFLGWARTPTAANAEFADEQRVINLGNDGDQVNLYAIWSMLVPEPESTTGEYTVRLKGGQSVEIVGLPHGTEYEIEEVDIPDGWRQTGSVNANGEIVVNETQNATVTNTYSAQGEAQIQVTKELVGDTLTDGQFSFELLDSTGTVIDHATNGYDLNSDGVILGAEELAAVRFDALTYTQEGTYSYFVREVEGSDARITYDGHTASVTVTVSDAGHGNLSTAVTFPNNNGVFENHVGEGSLTLSKAITGATAVSENQEFTFDVELTNPDGTPYNGVGYLVDGDEWVTSNLNLDGTQRPGSGAGGYEDYEHNRVYTGVVTIPGATTLHLSIDYSYIRGPFNIYQGEQADVLALEGQIAQYPGSVQPFYTGPWENGDALHHIELDVPGDTATLYTYSYRGVAGSYSPINQWTNYGVHVKATTGVAFDNGHMTVSLRGGESETITGLPDGVQYRITETTPSGWQQVSSEGTTGTIEAGKTAEAAFTNNYETHGSWTPKASKTLTGANLEANAYTFELVDESGQAVSGGTNDEEGHVTFAQINFDGNDHGKTYTYTMREVAGAEGNTTYDSHEETIIVRPVDNGDGTMTIMVSTDGGNTFVGAVDSEASSFSNTREEDKKSVKVTKTWLEGGVEVQWPESVTVIAVLSNESGEVSRATLSKTSPSATFSDLPVVDNENNTIEYTITEIVSGEIDCGQEAVKISSDNALDTWLLRNTLDTSVDVPFTGGDMVSFVLWASVIAVVVGAYFFMKTRRRADDVSVESE